MLDALQRGESPLASHLLWPGILDDDNRAQRKLGIEAGLAWGVVAEATVVYEDLGISSGMAMGIERAVTEGRPVEYRRIRPAVAQDAPNEKGGSDAAPSSATRTSGR